MQQQQNITHIIYVYINRVYIDRFTHKINEKNIKQTTNCLITLHRALSISVRDKYYIILPMYVYLYTFIMFIIHRTVFVVENKQV